MAKKLYQIPFRIIENTLHMVEYDGWPVPEVLRDNYVFKAELELVGHYRGRSAARVNVRNQANGEHYSMGFGAFYDAVKACRVQGNRLFGEWTFKKQGSNFGLVPVLEKSHDAT